MGAPPSDAARECNYELYVMTRAVADLAAASGEPERLARVRERVQRHQGMARSSVALAVQDAVDDQPDRPMEELCAGCSGTCIHR